MADNTKISGKSNDDDFSKLHDMRVNSDGSIINRDFFYELSRGGLSNLSSVFKFGRLNNAGATEQVVWDYGGDYNFLTSAEPISMVSTSTNDNPTGTGARSVVIYGQDDDFNEISEVLIPNGTTPVISTNSYRRFYRALVLTSGTDSPVNDANEGDLTFTSTITTKVQGQIKARNGQTLMAVYTVPAGKTGYITGIGVSTSEGKSVLVKAKFRNAEQDNGGAFSVKYTLDTYQIALSQDLKVPLKVPEKTDMCFTAIATASSTPISASFGIILEDN